MKNTKNEVQDVNNSAKAAMVTFIAYCIDDIINKLPRLPNTQLSPNEYMNCLKDILDEALQDLQKISNKNILIYTTIKYFEMALKQMRKGITNEYVEDIVNENV